MSKKFILPVMILVIASTALFGIAHTYAQSTPAEQAKYPAIVQKIADKFNLQITDVQAVFDQDKTDRQANMQAKYEEQLTQAVTDGKLTEAQKQAIIAKRVELQATMQPEAATLPTDDFKSMTDVERKAAMDQRKTAMEAQRTELEAWAKTNGIDTKYLFGLGGFGGRGSGNHGFGGPGMGMHNSKLPANQ